MSHAIKVITEPKPFLTENETKVEQIYRMNAEASKAEAQAAYRLQVTQRKVKKMNLICDLMRQEAINPEQALTLAN
jgi:hypothetical protein